MTLSRQTSTRLVATGVALALTLGAALPALADTSAITVSQPTTSAMSCVNITTNLMQGSRDKGTSSSVATLQGYLASRGYLASSSVIGIFGPLTRGAVVRYQMAQGLNAQGFVGPLTRARIMHDSCAGGGPVALGAPTLGSISPASGPVGTEVTLTGTNFADSNLVHFDFGGIQNVASTNGGTRIAFTVPNSLGPICKPGVPCPFMARLLTPGDYPVYVETASGTTSPMTFTISSTTTANITVQKVVVPDTLVARTGNGTWSLYLNLPDGISQSLHYAADWGDGTKSANQNVRGGGGASNPNTLIAVFTHVYQTAGTFTPAFTVSDDAGHSVRVVAGVTIAPNFNQQ